MVRFLVLVCGSDTNEPSAKTAMSYGCKQVDEFSDEINEITKVFAISRDDWINR